MKSRLGEWAGYAAYRTVSAAVFFIPRPAVLVLGRCLGRLFYRVSPRHRRIARANLEIAFGKEKTAGQRRAIARASFAHFGRVTLETIKFSHYSPDRILRLIDIEGGEHLERALAAGKGALAFAVLKTDICAQVVLTALAVITGSAGHHRFNSHTVTWRKPADFFANLHHFTGKFVPDCRRQCGRGMLTPKEM